ncbi:MAG: hypothetical protein RLZ12_492 [Bacillota bacterium]|jgi:glycosyltransferase involved in cell wall biosynthesis
MKVIIYPPTIDWDWMRQRPQQLLTQLSKLGYDVFYCNVTQRAAPLEQLSPTLSLVHNYQAWLKSTLPTFKKGYQKVILWCNSLTGLKEVNFYHADQVIYDCVDNFSEHYPSECNNIMHVSVLITSSQLIFERLKKTFPDKKIYIIRNGFDTELKQKNRFLPKKTSHPIIGYLGAWAPWVNTQLLNILAHELTGTEIFLIGAEYKRKFAKGTFPANIHFLGHKPHASLGDYLTRFNVGIIPFNLTPLTLAVNPVKVYEYFGFGLPVVTTNLPECKLMEPHLDLASNAEEFVRLVALRLKHPGNRLARKAFAAKESWQSRALLAKKIIEEL